MNSRAIAVAAAAVALLNDPTVQSGFVRPFTAARAYRPNYELKLHRTTTLVTVIPQALETSPFNRQIVEERVSIDVAVQSWVDTVTETADCDQLMQLVEQVKQTLEQPAALVLDDAPHDCGWQGTSNDPIFDPDHLQHDSVFTSVCTLTYLTRRAR